MHPNIGGKLRVRYKIVGNLNKPQKNPKFLWDFPTTSLDGQFPTRHHPVTVRDTGLCKYIIQLLVKMVKANS